MTDKFRKLNHVEEVSLTLDNKNNEKLNFDIPFKAVNHASDWPCLQHWNREYLIKNFGEHRFQAKRLQNGKESIKEFKLEDYLNYVNSTNDENPFYFKDCQIHLGTEMEEHYTIPSHFNCWYRQIKKEKRKSTLSWLYIGPKHSHSPLHADLWGTSAWNVIISGKKLWYFFHPALKKIFPKNNLDVFNPSQHQFPLLKNIRPVICIQQPGDLVYTPSNWLHAVYNLEPGLSLTENFINKTNYTNVLDFFKSKSPTSYKSLSEIVNKNIS